MTLPRTIAVVAGWGAVTLVLLLLGLDTAGGLLALVHHGGLLGAPLALVLNRRLRSVPVAIVLSIALSIALSALAVQSLVWFDAASPELLVIIGTAYGCTVASLVGAPVDDVGLW